MNAVASASRLPLAVLLGLFCFGSEVTAEPAAPDSENGRYTFSPVTGGLMRLDTRSGSVSNCSSSSAGWACYAVPDERTALTDEIARLQTQNEKLKAQLAAKGDDKQAGPNTADGQRKIEIPLPSDQDVDRAVSFLQRAWKRLVDMASQMQKDVSGDGKI